MSTLSDLLFAQDPHLQQIAKNLPTNAKYTSPEIQNEVIETLAEIVRETVGNECKESELFTLMMDGTTDSSRGTVLILLNINNLQLNPCGSVVSGC